MKKILIIDDDQDILETMGSLLESEGFAVQSAQTVDRGVQMIGDDQPDLILLDIMFPEKKAGGFEAAEPDQGPLPADPHLRAHRHKPPVQLRFQEGGCPGRGVPQQACAHREAGQAHQQLYLTNGKAKPVPVIYEYSGMGSLFDLAHHERNPTGSLDTDGLA